MVNVDLTLNIPTLHSLVSWEEYSIFRPKEEGENLPYPRENKLKYIKEIDMSKISVELDEKILEEAMRLTHAKTKKQVVNYALEDLVRRLKRRKILELEGKVQVDYVR